MERFRKLDDLVSALERRLLVALLGLMAFSVFADAMHRVFSADEGRLERIVVSLMPQSMESTARHTVTPVVLILIVFGVAYGAFRTIDRGDLPPMPAGRALLLAAASTVGLILATQALIRGLPNGLVWSQQMSLVFMLWVGFLGASLATKERSHIAFEVASRIWPKGWQGAVNVICRLVSAGFCVFLAILSTGFTHYHYREWADSNGAAGLFEAFAIPRWVAYGFLPFPFVVMAVRFIAYGVAPPDGGLPGMEPPAGEDGAAS